MTEHDAIENQEMVDEAIQDSRNVGVRRLVWCLGIISVIGLIVAGVAIVIALRNFYDLNKESLGLVRQVRAECEQGQIKDSICDKADRVEEKASSAPEPIILQGSDGEDGKTGPRGPEGKQGPKGEDGKPGPKGDDGDDGSEGIDGLSGLNGLSAYEVATTQGFDGTIDAWLASLKGEKGDKGDTGAAGADSTVPGPQGEPGQSAYPFTFTFVIPGNPPLWDATTYECVMTEPDVVEQCAEVEQTPTDPAS